MNATQRLLERVRARTSTGSDYAVAKALGIVRQRVSLYKAGHREMTDETTISRAAELLGEDAGAMLAEFQAERSTDDAVRGQWLRLAQLARRSAAAALLSAVGVSATVAPSPVAASSTHGGSGEVRSSVYYVTSRRRRSTAERTPLHLPPHARAQRPLFPRVRIRAARLA